MVRRLWQKLLLRPEELRPSHPDFQVVGVFNPGAVRVGHEVVLLVRVAERPRAARQGYTALPRWAPGLGPVIDWLPDADLEAVDPRVVRRKAAGLVRLTFLSHLRVIRCGSGREVEDITTVSFVPQSELEEFGVEDPRLTPLDGRFYFSYVAVSRHGAATALASTTDFRTFQRHGLLFYPENKDVVLFPEKVGGAYVALHRPNGATPFTRPEMWLARSPDLRHWGQQEPLWWGELGTSAAWETGRTGAGPPPLRTPEGWLEIYHGNRRPRRPGEVGAYSAGGLLLDLENPARIRGRTAAAILEPDADFERQGFVPDVIFPTGLVETGDTLLVYYGAADTCTGVVEISRKELHEAFR